MKIRLTMLAVVVFCASVCLAGEKPTPGTVVSMQAVDCGTKKESKKKSTALLCHQYVVRTTTTEYQVRQQKSGDEAIVPASTPIEFTLDKNKMKFKWNGKKFEYLVVGTSAIQPS